MSTKKTTTSYRIWIHIEEVTKNESGKTIKANDKDCAALGGGVFLEGMAAFKRQQLLQQIAAVLDNGK